MAANNPEEATGELVAREPNLSEIRKLKNAFEAQKRKLNNTKELLEKTMSLNLQLKEELGQARDKIKKQAEEIAELYDLQDELEQYTRKNSVEICGIPEKAYKPTEVAVLKINHHLIEKELKKVPDPL